MASKIIRRRGIALNVRQLVRQWLLADDAQKEFSGQATKMKDQLKDILAEDGEADENGHRWIDFSDDPVEGRIEAIKRERRVSRTLDLAKAERFLKDKGWWETCTETVTQVVINEDAILARSFQGDMTEEELEALYIVTETFAFVPKRAKR